MHGDVRQPGDLAELRGLSTRCWSARPSRRCWPGSTAGATSWFTRTCSAPTTASRPPRADGAQVIFLSTSRVYPIAGARARWRCTRRASPLRALDGEGIAEDFPLAGERTLYGATKLAAELLLAEYDIAVGGEPLRRDRRAVADGQGRPGRVHPLGALAPLRAPARPTSGFGGTGKQVRDLLHVDDLDRPDRGAAAGSRGLDGATYNVGGGRTGSLSLLRDHRAVPGALRHASSRWAPRRRRALATFRTTSPTARRCSRRRTGGPAAEPRAVLADIFAWIDDHADMLARTL